MKRLLCALLALLTLLTLFGCTSKAEKEAAAQETLRQEALAAAWKAVDNYNLAADAYERSLDEYNARVEEIVEANAAFDAALDAVQERIDSEPIPADPDTLTAVQDALAAAREARAETPAPFQGKIERLSRVDDALSEADARALAAKAESDAVELSAREAPALPDVPDYSEALAAVDAALEPYAASVEAIRPVVAPSDEYVSERLLTVSSVAAVNGVTEGHDPNGNLGKDGGYIGCIFWRDSRISVWSFRLNPGSDRNDPVDVGTQGGGCVEIYQTQKEAQNREVYLSRFKNQIGAYTVLGSLVIRVSDQLSKSKQNQLLEEVVQALLPTE